MLMMLVAVRESELFFSLLFTSLALWAVSEQTLPCMRSVVGIYFFLLFGDGRWYKMVSIQVLELRLTYT